MTDPIRTEEQACIARYLAGDTDAFAPLYERYANKVYLFLYTKTLHKETAEDLTSHTFIKALDSLSRYDPSKACFLTWLYRIARNVLVDYCRAERRHLPYDEGIFDMASTIDVEREAGTAHILRTVRTYLSTLKPEQKDMVIMRLWDGLTYEEIASVTGKTEASCKMAVSRTLAALRKDLAHLIAAGLILFN